MKDAMRRVRARWPARSITAVMTLALVFASTVGAYAHAAGHTHHASAHAVQSEHPDRSGSISDEATDLHDEHGMADPGKGHTNCCDTICHGGYAILGVGYAFSAPVNSRPATLVTARATGTRPSSLERPPRSPVLA